MVKEIVKYPNIQTVAFDAPVRVMNDEIKELIQNLKDTINEHNLKGLAAYQINNPYNVVIVKDENDEFLVLINPNIYSSSGEITSDETSLYFGDIKAKITRNKEIKIMYEDTRLNTQYLNANDEFAILLQRKIDYTLGGTIRYRLSEDEQDEFDMKLQYGEEFSKNTSCPTTFVKDKILSFTEYLIAISFGLLLLVFFLNDENDLILQSIESYSMISILILILTYFLYGQYESKANKGCSTCQIGHIFGNAAIAFAKLSVLFILNYFIF